MTLKEPLINDTLLQLKYRRIITLLTEKLNIDILEAMDIFYTSDFYKELSNKDNHLHNMGDLYLAESIILELQKNNAEPPAHPQQKGTEQ